MQWHDNRELFQTVRFYAEFTNTGALAGKMDDYPLHLACGSGNQALVDWILATTAGQIQFIKPSRGEHDFPWNRALEHNHHKLALHLVKKRFQAIVWDDTTLLHDGPLFWDVFSHALECKSMELIEWLWPNAEMQKVQEGAQQSQVQLQIPPEWCLEQVTVLNDIECFRRMEKLFLRHQITGDPVPDYCLVEDLETKSNGHLGESTSLRNRYEGIMQEAVNNNSTDVLGYLLRHLPEEMVLKMRLSTLGLHLPSPPSISTCAFLVSQEGLKCLVGLSGCQ